MSLILDRFKKHANDTGSVETQVVRLTESIKKITVHTQNNPKDQSSRRGLLMLVSRRKRFLEYVKNKDEATYKALVKELGLRK